MSVLWGRIRARHGGRGGWFHPYVLNENRTLKIRLGAAEESLKRIESRSRRLVEKKIAVSAYSLADYNLQVAEDYFKGGGDGKV